jgi:hypothetical protein
VLRDGFLQAGLIAAGVIVGAGATGVMGLLT